MITRGEALALIDRLLDAGRRRDVEGVRACYAEDAVAESPVFGEVRGRGAIGATWLRLFATFLDVAIDISDVLVDGDRVAVLSTIRTTDETGWFGQRPTHAPIGYRLVLLLTIANGLIARDQRIYDSAGVVERLEKARLDRELRIAADVQRALLPRTAHLARFCEAIGDSLPCRAIGGDFFDFVDLPSGDVGVLMGDVAGKGPPAALLASMLLGMFAADAPSAPGPAALLAAINRRLAARQVDSRFATMAYAVISPDGRLVYSNAGHNPPALLSGGRVRWLAAGGPILGAFAEAAFEEERLQLEGDSTIVMFTDGATEARNDAGEEYGETQLVRSIQSNATARPDALLRAILSSVRDFCAGADQADDITVAVARFIAA